MRDKEAFDAEADLAGVKEGECCDLKIVLSPTNVGWRGEENLLWEPLSRCQHRRRLSLHHFLCILESGFNLTANVQRVLTIPKSLASESSQRSKQRVSQCESNP